MNVSQDFFLKNRLVIMKLARDFLVLDMESKMPTISELEEKFQVSRGTVQSAMQFLTDNNCIQTRFRGHLGTFLVGRDIDRLWEYSGFGSLTGAMPLPLNSLISGLATGICDCMKIKQVPFNLTFLQGSRTRAVSLGKNRCDFVVASKLTAGVLMEERDGIESVMELPGSVYGGKYALLFSEPGHSGITDGMTVAVDPTSIDQYYLTGLLCRGHRYTTFLETTYINTAWCVAEGNADVVVSRMDAIQRQFPHMHWQDIRLPDVSQQEIRSYSGVTILANRDNYGIRELLRAILDAPVVEKSQKQVMEGARMPAYY